MRPRHVAAWAALALAISIATGTPRAQSPAAASLEFVSPRRLATVVGASKAQLAVTPPAGSTVVSIVFYVDGQESGTQSAPPWIFAWSGGDGTAGHRLKAVATFSDGTTATATVDTSRLAINETEEVALVNVYAIARDAKGGYLSDLAATDFKVFENDRPQTIDRFFAERRPLRIAIVLDTSLSMQGEKLKAAIASAVEFLNILQPGDEGLVIGFSDEVRILRDLTSNRGELESAIRGVEAKGGTSLYDAIFKASERLAEFEGRRVLVVLSDGRDEAANGLEAGSLHTLDEAQERALRDEVMVFAIGLGRSLARDAKVLREDPTARADEMDFYGRKALVSILDALAQTTGGTAVFSPGAAQLRRSFELVANDLRHQYALAYRSDDKRHDGAWRAIRVAVLRPGVSVTNRKGYYAPSDVPLPRTKAKLRP
jgi:Ca-activated chloride channel family protein